MKIGRRSFLKAVVIAPMIPLTTSQTNSSSVETPYEEPFEGYSNYIDKLKQNIGEKISVQDSFDIITLGKYVKLTGLARITETNPRLFPHAVSLDDGSTLNLRNIKSIIKHGTSEIRVYPYGEGTLYLDIPGQKAFEKSMSESIEFWRKMERKYS